MQVKVELPPGGLRHLCDTALHPCCSAARLALDLEEGGPMMGYPVAVLPDRIARSPR
jgi:hypothetical protein